MEVLYEDAALIAVNKPAGLAVHAGAGLHDGTLVNRLVHRFGALSQHFADQFGWLELTHAVESAAAQLPRGERAAIFTQNYGEAGALELLGRGLPPVVSGHNSYFTWGPPEADVLLVVGGREDDARRACADLRTVARFAHAVWAMPYEQDLLIFSCRGLRIPIAELWVRLKHYE